MIHKPLKTVSLGFGAAMVTSVSFALIQPQWQQSAPPLASMIESRPLKEIEPEPRNRVLHHRIRPGETLSEIFSRQGLSQALLASLMAAPEAKTLNRLVPGKLLDFTISPEAALISVSYEKSPFETLTATHTDQGFVFERALAPVKTNLQTAQAVINNSLFADGQAAGIPARVLAKLADIFAYDIDFAHEVKKGDHFSLVYQERRVKGEAVASGRVLAAEFNANGKTYQAVYFADGEHKGAYYRPDGRALRKAFIRTPVPFSRISSHFNLHRKHPVLNRIRAHKGVDYAAPTGTPVQTTADGKVAFKGWKGGYGRCVIVRHGRHYSTLYGHLSRFPGHLNVGKTVKQGQVIGYVGQSGLATGPHLHYEFRIDGVHKNPLTVALPNSPAIPKNRLGVFSQQIQPYLARLETLKTTQLAKAEAIE